MLQDGVLVEGYRIDRLIGEGGMGIVYEATQLSLDRKVALKLLTAELSADSGFRERFRHEARIQGAMDHPNIVTVHEAGESDYGLFIAMELIRGATLKDLIVGRELDAGRTLRILGQVSDALDSAHEAGLIHRDIKPHNILVRAGRRDHAYLADFGVTKVRGGTNLTKTGHFVGTVDYMAPEQIRGEPATRETDIYALGTVLYECLSGVVPFPKDSDVAVMYAHLADPPPRITHERPELPPELDAVIQKAMAKNPGERYPSAMRMMEAFEQALGDARGAVQFPPPVEAPEEIGLREDGQPDTAASATRDATQAAPIQKTPAPQTQAAPIQQTPAPATQAAPVQPTPPPPSAEPEPTPAEAGVAVPAGATVGSATVAASSLAAADSAAAAAPAEVAAPPAERRAPSGLIWAVAALLVAALAAGGFFVGHSSGGSSKEASSDGISAGKATVAIPDGWSELKSVPKIPYLPLKDPVGMAPTADRKSGLVLGTATLAYPYNLPLSVIGHERAQPRNAYNQRSSIVKIGKLDAFRASGIAFAQSGRPLYTFIWFPQGKSQTTMAVCYSRTASVSALTDCEKVANGIRVSGSKVYSLVPSSAYAAQISKALRNLASAHTRGLKALRGASSASKQAAAARKIAQNYRSVRSQVRRAGPPPYARPASNEIADAIGGAAGAYSSLASAASAKSSRRYSTASKAVTTAENKISSAVSGLKLLGYQLS